jgi:manganese/zinc/iron transport system permease protein
MTWSPEDSWVVLVGVLCALSCALLGNFLLLRRMSMMGDAISHAVLPGLAAAFLLTESRASLPMFLGAIVVGVLTALFTQWVRNVGKVDEGAAMGVVFTALFALGLVMIVQAADKVDLDPGCVLYGAIELTPLNPMDMDQGVPVMMPEWVPLVGDTPLPLAAAVLSIVLLINATTVVLLFKELKISSFDPALATTLGINATAMHYLLMTLTAVTAVACFESVGSILVVAMLIVPAAAAHLLTDRLAPMIVVSLVIGAASAVLGHVSAITVPGWFGFASTSTAGMMAVAAGGLLALAVLAAPRHGVVSRLIHRAALSLRIVREDALGLIYRLQEHGRTMSRKDLSALLSRMLDIRSWTAKLALANLSRGGLVRDDGGGLRLTPTGRSAAEGLVRAHRLWESYLVKELGLPPDHVHDAAMRLEHVTDHEMQRELAQTIGPAVIDPHGRAIPKV